MIERGIFARLQSVTPEEQAILDGQSQIDRDLYMTGTENEVSAKRLLPEGAQIAMRPHTRFLHFPEHSHDYVEIIYVCSGEVTHVVEGKAIRLRAGEFLFLKQHVQHEVHRAEAKDVSVNFIVLPEFFSVPLGAIGEEDAPMRRFLVDCLFDQSSSPGYLYFPVSEDVSVRNLAENLMIALLEKASDDQKISRMTLTLLLLELAKHTERPAPDARERVSAKILRYIDGHYASGSLTDAAERFHCDLSALSRDIRRQTGKTYTELVQEKRMRQAAFLLRATDRKVSDIALAVGYENVSYFHRLFRSVYGVSPRQFRAGK